MACQILCTLWRIRVLVVHLGVSGRTRLPAQEKDWRFWIIKAPDLGSAQRWAEQAAVACQGPVEVRPLQGGPMTERHLLLDRRVPASRRRIERARSMAA